MKSTSKKGITTTIAAVLAIVTLIVGLIIGVFAAPSLFPSESEDVGAQERIDALNAELDTVKADLDGALKEIEDLKKVGLTGEVKIGFLADLTGPLATFGENELTAARLAEKHVNDLLKDAGADWTLKIIAEDVQTKADITLEKTESFAARGITLLIGPLPSSGVRAIKGYCDANKILAISQSSTAPDLAIGDDYIFRFCPTDKLGQGPATARLFYDDGKPYVIPITRNDAWGVGLEESAKKRYTTLGGTFLEGIRYAEEAQEFTAEAADLASKVESAVATYGAENVVVWAITFEEANPLITAASAYDVLRTVKWYGCDGTANSADLVDDPVVGEFASSVNFLSMIFAPTTTDKYEIVRQNGIEQLGREPDAYSYAVYDVVMAYAYALMVVDKYDAEAVREVLPTVVASLYGATGWIDLDEFGDRKVGDYDIWKIEETPTGEYDWVHAGTWIFSTDMIMWK